MGNVIVTIATIAVVFDLVAIDTGTAIGIVLNATVIIFSRVIVIDIIVIVIDIVVREIDIVGSDMDLVAITIGKV